MTRHINNFLKTIVYCCIGVAHQARQTGFLERLVQPWGAPRQIEFWTAAQLLTCYPAFGDFGNPSGPAAALAPAGWGCTNHFAK